MKYFNQNYSKAKNGFTLSEVLIALVIIGVIAALTIPMLIQNTNKAEYVAGLRKSNSMLQQGLYTIARNKDASPGDYSFVKTANLSDEYANVLNIIKRCDTTAECWGSNIANGSVYKNLDNTNMSISDGRSFITADGQLVSYCTIIGESTVYGIPEEDRPNVAFRILIDVNGHKIPNKLGRDVFIFYIITNKGIVPAGVDGTLPCNISTKGYACAAKVLKERAMNY